MGHIAFLGFNPFEFELKHPSDIFSIIEYKFE